MLKLEGCKVEGINNVAVPGMSHQPIKLKSFIDFSLCQGLARLFPPLQGVRRAARAPAPVFQSPCHPSHLPLISYASLKDSIVLHSSFLADYWTGALCFVARQTGNLLCFVLPVSDFLLDYLSRIKPMPFCNCCI